MTVYDDWKTTKQEIDDAAWEDATEYVFCSMQEDEGAEVVSILANSDDVLTWLCHAVEVPQHHLHAFRDLIKLASGIRKEVETEMKANRDDSR